MSLTLTLVLILRSIEVTDLFSQLLIPINNGFVCLINPFFFRSFQYSPLNYDVLLTANCCCHVTSFVFFSHLKLMKIAEKKQRLCWHLKLCTSFLLFEILFSHIVHTTYSHRHRHTHWIEWMKLAINAKWNLCHKIIAR